MPQLKLPRTIEVGAVQYRIQWAELGRHQAVVQIDGINRVIRVKQRARRDDIALGVAWAVAEAFKMEALAASETASRRGQLAGLN